MARIEKNGNSFSLKLSEAEAKSLNIAEGKNFSVAKVRDGLFVFEESAGEKEKNALLAGRGFEQQREPSTSDPADETAEKSNPFAEQDRKIFSLLESLPAADIVEGKFEKQLNKEELERFQSLLKGGGIERFKSSPKYFKFLYRQAAKPAKKKESENPAAEEKAIEEYSLEKDGFFVAKNEERVKRISQEFEEKIKNGEIRGMKSFDGNYYIVEDALLQKHRQKVLDCLKAEKQASVETVAQKTSISKTLAKICCEFLKEDGEIMEKRRDMYSFIE
ncbi:MAG: hypothetical protein HY394_04500 [Candidatus Diapherotrites archaeon]|nr:hypothetical protein [Candidatus Diapherotrites archaeon]